MIKIIQKVYGYFITTCFLSFLSKVIVFLTQLNYLTLLLFLMIMTFTIVQIQFSRDSESPFAFLVRSRFR